MQHRGGETRPSTGLITMKIALVAGTRPEVVKLAPVHTALQGAGFESVWISTEQQATLNAQTLDVMGVTPDVRLEPPSPDRTLRLLHTGW